MFEILRGEHTGPKGGQRWLWEVAEPDEWHYTVIMNNVPPTRTLRASQRHPDTAERLGI